MATPAPAVNVTADPTKARNFTLSYAPATDCPNKSLFAIKATRIRSIVSWMKRRDIGANFACFKYQAKNKPDDKTVQHPAFLDYNLIVFQLTPLVVRRKA